MKNNYSYYNYYNNYNYRMNIFISTKGYYYKKYKNGKIKRISKDNYNKIKLRNKKHKMKSKVLKGGNTYNLNKNFSLETTSMGDGDYFQIITTLSTHPDDSKIFLKDMELNLDRAILSGLNNSLYKLFHLINEFKNNDDFIRILNLTEKLKIIYESFSDMIDSKKKLHDGYYIKDNEQFLDNNLIPSMTVHKTIFDLIQSYKPTHNISSEKINELKVKIIIYINSTLNISDSIFQISEDVIINVRRVITNQNNHQHLLKYFCNFIPFFNKYNNNGLLTLNFKDKKPIDMPTCEGILDICSDLISYINEFINKCTGYHDTLPPLFETNIISRRFASSIQFFINNSNVKIKNISKIKYLANDTINKGKQSEYVLKLFLGQFIEELTKIKNELMGKSFPETSLKKKGKISETKQNYEIFYDTYQLVNKIMNQFFHVTLNTDNINKTLMYCHTLKEIYTILKKSNKLNNLKKLLFILYDIIISLKIFIEQDTITSVISTKLDFKENIIKNLELYEKFLKQIDRSTTINENESKTFTFLNFKKTNNKIKLQFKIFDLKKKNILLRQVYELITNNAEITKILIEQNNNYEKFQEYLKNNTRY